MSVCLHIPPCGPNDDCGYLEGRIGSARIFPNNAVSGDHSSSGTCRHGTSLAVHCVRCEEERIDVQASAVKHPSHYGGDTTYEAIKVIEAWNLTFNTGNATKYICRAGKKGSPGIDNHVEDLEKAREYLRFEIERFKRMKK